MPSEDNTELVKLTDFISKKDNEIQRLKNTLSDREKKILQLSFVYNEEKVKALRLSSVLQERDKEISQLQKTIREKDAEIERLQKNISSPLLPLSPKRFVSVIFDATNPEISFDYLMGEIEDLKIGDRVLVPIKNFDDKSNKAKSKKTTLKPAIVKRISEPGEVSQHARSSVVKKLDKKISNRTPITAQTSM